MIAPQPYNRAIPIVKSDTVNIPDLPGGAKMMAIFVGGTGDMVLVYADGSTCTLSGCLAGTIYPVQCVRVNSASTTATLMVALYRV